jgi:hypothetical protein
MFTAAHAPASHRARSIKIVAVLTALFTALLLSSAATEASAKPRQAAPTTATVTGVAETGEQFVGTFDVERFAVQGGQLVAIGDVQGTVTDAEGVVGQVDEQVTFVVDLAQTTGSCQILDLVLGPLDLDVLGLVIHLDQVELNITAQSGPGNLLGNLLCAIAGLLDGPTGLNAILTQIANLLNQLLGVLG